MTVNPRKMKVVDLREELARRGKPTTGLKNDLIARLEAALDEEAFGVRTKHVYMWLSCRLCMTHNRMGASCVFVLPPPILFASA